MQDTPTVEGQAEVESASRTVSVEETPADKLFRYIQSDKKRSRKFVAALTNITRTQPGMSLSERYLLAYKAILLR